MSRKLVVWIVVIAVVAAAAVGVAVMKRKGAAKGAEATVKVERGNVVEKALAVGSIVPRNEISVKSKISGVVKRIYREPGQSVSAGDALIEIRPDPTPLELADARRRVDMDEIAYKNYEKAMERAGDLMKQGLISDKEFEEVQKNYDQAKLQLEMSRERLELIEKGHASIAGREIDAVVKSPIAGFILEKNINLGDPVVPLTSYQPGTEMASIADMSDLIFEGTVDEIDVGKITDGMAAEIQIGALPDSKIVGRVDRIFPKAKKEGNATLFDIWIIIGDASGVTLRAGFSATASIQIRERKNVVLIPERLILFEDGKKFVEVPDGETTKKVEVRTGLSDGLNIEILDGLKEGDKVVERPPREIK